MNELSAQNLKKVYQELDEVGVAISVVGTRRQKLIELAQMVLPISSALIGSRPEVKKVRDDLVRLAHNVKSAQTRARPASQAVRALASQVKLVEVLVQKGLGNVPVVFRVGEMALSNVWGYREKEAKPFLEALGQAVGIVEKMGLTKEVGSAKVSLEPGESKQSSMTYDLFSDTFVANPSYKRERLRGISDAIGSQLWWKFFEHRDVETWGGSSVAFLSFLDAFFKLLSGKKIPGDESAKMTVSLGRIVGPERWRKVA